MTKIYHDVIVGNGQIILDCTRTSDPSGIPLLISSLNQYRLLFIFKTPMCDVSINTCTCIQTIEGPFRDPEDFSVMF